MRETKTGRLPTNPLRRVFSCLVAIGVWAIPSLAYGQGLPAANTVYAGPTSGSAAAPSFRALGANDVPAGAIPLPSGDILVGSAGGAAAAVVLSGDCTITNAGAITCLKTNGVAFGTAATQNTGTSGATIPLLNGNNTYGGTATFSSTATFNGLVNFTSTFQISGNTVTWPGSATTVAALNIADQTLTGGANVTQLGLTTGNVTIDCGSRPLQSITNGGAFTITAPSNDGSCIVLTTNNGSAGTITFSGFSVGSSTGDSLDTTNAHKFSIFVWRVNGTSGYRVAAHQ